MAVEPSIEEAQQRLAPWLLVGPVLAYAAWTFFGRFQRLIPAWQGWHSRSPESYPHEFQYRFWTSFGGMLNMLVIAVVLLGSRQRGRRAWAFIAFAVCLMIGVEVVQHWADTFSR